MTNEDIIALLGAPSPILAGVGAAAMQPEGERLGPALGAGAGSMAGHWGGSLLGALLGGGLGAGAGAIHDKVNGRSFWDDLTGEPTGAQVGAAYGAPLGGLAGALAGGAVGARKGFKATQPKKDGLDKKDQKSKDDKDDSGDREKESSYQENNMSIEKIAAGYGAIARLNDEGIDPVRFVKVASQTNDRDMHVLADCIIAAAGDMQQTKTANRAVAGAMPDDILPEILKGLGRGTADAAGSMPMKSNVPVGADQPGFLRNILGLPGNIMDQREVRKQQQALLDQIAATGNPEDAASMNEAIARQMEHRGLRDWGDRLNTRNEELGGRIREGGLGAAAGVGGLGALGAGAYGIHEATREPTLMERLGLG